MGGSPFFARIREHVLQLAAAIPEGSVCTYQSMGEYLDVMPRHVAYILSQLTDEEKFVYPWYRVVSADGALGAPRQSPDGTSQSELLRAEGMIVSGNRIASGFEQVFVAAEDLPSGLARQRRLADAPAPKQRRASPPRNR